MELKREQIIKALECCRTNSEMDCIDCHYRNKGNDLYDGCVNTLLVDALSLIKELTEEVESLKQCMEHEHASFMETFGEYGEKCDKLAEENERLRAPRFISYPDGTTEMIPSVESVRADTVRKMRELIKVRCIKGGIYPAFVASTIYQIAKEMIGEGND